MTSMLLRADAKALPLSDASVDLIVTSPPYFALRSYTDGGEHYEGQIGSEATPAEYIAALIECTREWARVLKPSGSMFVNLGDSYYSGKGAPGRTTVDGKSEARTVRRAGGNPLDGPSFGIGRKSLILLPERYRIACVDELGLIARAVIVWAKPNGLPESVTDRVRRAHEDWVHLTKAPRYFAAVDEIRETAANPGKNYGANGAGATAMRARNTSIDNNAAPYAGPNPLGKLPGSVWEIATQPLTVPAELGVDHFAAFPMEWPRRLILGWSPSGICVECGEGRRPVTDARAAQPKDWALAQRGGRSWHSDGDNSTRALGTPASERQRTITGYACKCAEPTAPTRPAVVLDPFGGTGTTALVASVLGRVGISVDLSADYCRLARWRTTDAKQLERAKRGPTAKRKATPPEIAVMRSVICVGEGTHTRDGLMVFGEQVLWGNLHAGDVVAGADGREWTVTSVGGKQRWVVGGPVVDFKLCRDETQVVTTQKLTEPAPLVRRGDHTEAAVAVDAFLGAGLTVEILREDAMTETSTPDPFSNPATAPSRAGHKRPEPKFDQWQRYKLPHPETGVEQAWTRVSTVSRTLSDEYGLTQWKLRMAVAGVARRADLIAGAAAADPETDKQALDGIVRSALERAESSRGANLGSAVHKFTERLDAGESIAAMGVPEGLVKDIEAYAATLKAAGLTVVTDLAERVAVNIALNYAGRIDRVVRDRAGTYYILDLKTAKDLAYSWLEIGIQLGGYANATHMALADLSGYEPMPAVDRMKGLVLHLPIGKAAGQVYAVDIAKGWAAFQTAVRVREMRSAAKEMAWTYSPGTPADAVRLRIGRAVALDELGAAVEDAKRISAWDAETEAYALARYDMIRVAGAPDRGALAALWEELTPAGRWTDDIAELAGRRAAELAPAGVAA